MGTAGDFIRRRAEEEARNQLKGYTSRAERNSRADTVGKQTTDGKYVTLPNGEVKKLIKDGTPNEVDACIKVSSDTYYMPSPYTKHIHIAASGGVWALLGQYPAGINPASQPTLAFPVFNLANLSTGDNYSIPGSLLPHVFSVDPYSTTQSEGDATIRDVGYNGCFMGALNSSADTIVIVRVNYQQTVLGSSTDATLHVFYDVITDFTLEDGVVTGGTVLGGLKHYEYTHVKSENTPSNTPTVSSPFVFRYWEFTSNINTMLVDPVITFTSSGVRIDLYGKWDTTASGVGMVSLSDGSFLQDAFVYSHVEGGVYIVEDVAGANTVSYIDLGGQHSEQSNFGGGSTHAEPASQTGYVTCNTEIRSTSGGGAVLTPFGLDKILLNKHHYNLTFTSTDDPSFSLFKYGKGKTSVAYRTFSTDANKSYAALFMSPWNTIAEEVALEAPSGTRGTNAANPRASTYYIGDGTRMYSPTSSWSGRYNVSSTTYKKGFVKTTADGAFQELQINVLTPVKVEKWKFDAGTATITTDGTVDVNDSPLVVVGAEGSTNQLWVMDFAITS